MTGNCSAIEKQPLAVSVRQPYKWPAAHVSEIVNGLCPCVHACMCLDGCLALKSPQRQLSSTDSNSDTSDGCTRRKRSSDAPHRYC